MSDDINIDQLSEKIADRVYDQFAETFKPFMTTLEGIAIDIAEIKKIQVKMDDRVKNDERRIEAMEQWQERKRLRIEKLETRVALLEPEKQQELFKYFEEIRILSPIIKKWNNFLNWWTVPKLIGLVIVMMILFYGLNALMHWTGMVTFIDNNSHAEKTLIDDTFKDVREGNIGSTTRSVKTKVMTKAETDSMITINQEGIMRSIEERNKKLKSIQ
jgi:hypothetical protein